MYIGLGNHNLFLQKNATNYKKGVNPQQIEGEYILVLSNYMIIKICEGIKLGI